jgi:hypothetical protein
MRRNPVIISARIAKIMLVDAENIAHNFRIFGGE